MTEKDKYIVSVSKRKRVVLKPREVFILRQILIHEVVPSRVIHDLFRAEFKGITTNVISNRIKRFVDTGILVKMEEPITMNHYIHHLAYYKLGNKGLQKLYELSDRNREELEKQRLRIEEKGILNNIELAGTLIVNDVFLKFYSSEDWMVYGKAENHSLLLKNIHNNKYSMKGNMRPTWFFETDIRIMYLVIVPERMRFQKIDGYFLNMYNDLAEDARKVGKELFLIFSCIDNSSSLFATRNIDSVNGNVIHLKANMPSFHDWDPNLHVYVLPASRTAARIFEIFSDYEDDRRMNQLNLGFYLRKLNVREFKFKEHPIQENNSFKIVFEENYVLKYANDLRFVGMIKGNEGSVYTFQRIRTLSKQIQYRNTLSTDVPDSLWVVYPRKQNQREDIILSEWDVNTWLTDMMTWEYGGSYNYRFPKMDKLLHERITRETMYFENMDTRYEEDFQEVYVPCFTLRDELHYYYRPLTGLKNKWKRDGVLGRWLWAPRVETETHVRRFDAVCEIRLSNQTIQCLFIQENRNEDFMDHVRLSLDMIQLEKEKDKNLDLRHFPIGKNQLVFIVLPMKKRILHYYSNLDLTKYHFPIVFMEENNEENDISSVYNRAIIFVDNNELKQFNERYLMRWLNNTI